MHITFKIIWNNSLVRYIFDRTWIRSYFNLSQLATLEGEKHEVTTLASSPDKLHLAVGYTDGTIKIFNILTGEVAVTFSGHKSAVTALNYDHDGVRLVSGSKVKMSANFWGARTVFFNSNYPKRTWLQYKIYTIYCRMFCFHYRTQMWSSGTSSTNLVFSD